MSAGPTAAEFPFDVEGLEARVTRQLRVASEDWLDACRRLSVFEERYLADDPLNQEALAKHARALSVLEWLGRLISNATADPKFNDRQFAAYVASIIQDLKDRRAMWHGKSSAEQRNQILRDVFNEV